MCGCGYESVFVGLPCMQHVSATAPCIALECVPATSGHVGGANQHIGSLHSAPHTHGNRAEMSVTTSASWMGMAATCIVLAGVSVAAPGVRAPRICRPAPPDTATAQEGPVRRCLVIGDSVCDDAIERTCLFLRDMAWCMTRYLCALWVILYEMLRSDSMMCCVAVSQMFVQ